MVSFAFKASTVTEAKVCTVCSTGFSDIYSDCYILFCIQSKPALISYAAAGHVDHTGFLQSQTDLVNLDSNAKSIPIRTCPGKSCQTCVA